MKRRITEAIVGVSALILLVLGIPLAIAVHHSIRDSEVVELQASAARTLTEMGVPLDKTQLAAVRREPDARGAFSVYGPDGRLFFGDGPSTGDDAVRRALTGTIASTAEGEIVVATPITDDTTEQIVGVVRLTESLGEANRRARTAWAVMAAAALAALGIGWVVARRLARALSRPVSELATEAARIGDGGVLEPIPPSGIAEIDTLAVALTRSSQQVNEALVRERRFSADVSHQLRTPLTALRLRLDAAQATDDPDAIRLALGDLTRIEETVDHLLAFVRDAMPTWATARLDLAAHRAVERWTDRAADNERGISATPSEPVTARASAPSIDQILDVLIDNAIHHGHGHITIRQRHLTGGGAIDVADEGSSIAAKDVERIFERGHGSHNGIGLAFARSIAEAEGGRVVLSHRHPTTFSLILLHPSRDGGHA